MIRRLLQRLRRIDHEHLVAADEDSPTADRARHHRAVADLHAWISSDFYTLPPEPTPGHGQILRSRVSAMLDACDLLLDNAARVIVRGIDDPAQLDLNALRTLLPFAEDVADSMLALDVAPAPASPQRPQRLPQHWRTLADRVTEQRAHTQPSIGDRPTEPPDPTFT
jgi:hypothetical protein